MWSISEWLGAKDELARTVFPAAPLTIVALRGKARGGEGTRDEADGWSAGSGLQGARGRGRGTHDCS